jgi:succinate dehydrogenase / fumarate reductase, membrane anchor subunit
MSFQTPLAKVKYLGSIRQGKKHFIAQRISAVFLLVLVVWVLNAFVLIAGAHEDMVTLFSKSAFNMGMAIMFVGTFLYHGYLGLQMVCEDYIRQRFLLIFSLIMIKAVCIITFIMFAMSIFTLRSLSVVVNSIFFLFSGLI